MKVTLHCIYTTLCLILNFNPFIEINCPQISVRVPKSTNKVGMLDIGNQDAEVGFGYNGECLVGTKQSSNLNLYQFTNNQHKLLWRKPIPNGLNYNCRKFIAPSGTIVMRNPGYDKQPTPVFDRDLKPLKYFTPTSDYINGLHRDDYITYFKLCRDHTRGAILLKSLKNHNLLVELDQPFQGSLQLGDWVHLCANPTSGWIVLVNYRQKWLDIFDDSGWYIKRKLMY